LPLSLLIGALAIGSAAVAAVAVGPSLVRAFVERAPQGAQSAEESRAAPDMAPAKTVPELPEDPNRYRPGLSEWGIAQVARLVDGDGATVCNAVMMNQRVAVTAPGCAAERIEQRHMSGWRVTQIERAERTGSVLVLWMAEEALTYPAHMTQAPPNEAEVRPSVLAGGRVEPFRICHLRDAPSAGRRGIDCPNPSPALGTAVFELPYGNFVGLYVAQDEIVPVEQIRGELFRLGVEM